MATLNDIAKQCALSKTTVSVILAGKHEQYNLASETVDRVLKVARDLHYYPNLTARGLKLRRTHCIGVGVYDLTYLTHTPFALLFAGAALRAAQDDYRLEFCITDPAQTRGRMGRLHFLHKARRSSFDGLIVYDQIVPDVQVLEVAELGIPVVSIERHIEGSPNIVSIRADYEKGATEYLDRGYENLALVVSLPNAYRTRKIIQGCSDAMQKRGRHFGPEMVLEVSSFNQQEIEEVVRQFLKGPAAIPTGFVCWDETAAELTLQALLACGRRVPEEFGVLSLVDCSPYSDLYHISAVVSHATEVGEKSVTKILSKVLRKGAWTSELLAPSINWRTTTF